MLGVLCLAAALAEPLTDADQARLLGPEPVASPTAAPAAAPSVPWWSVPLGAAALGAAAWAQRRVARAPAASEALRVIGQATLGPQSAVHVVEVRDADGRWRRLLLAATPSGAQLLTGLGAGPAFANTFADALDDLPEVPAYPVPAPPIRPAPAEPARAEPARAEPAPPIRYEPPPVRAEPARAEPARAEPPPVRVPRGYQAVAAGTAPAPARSVAAGLDLLDEVRRSRPARVH